MPSRKLWWWSLLWSETVAVDHQNYSFLDSAVTRWYILDTWRAPSTARWPSSATRTWNSARGRGVFMPKRVPGTAWRLEGNSGEGPLTRVCLFFPPMKFCLFIALSIASLYRCPSFSPVAAAAGQAVLREVQRQGGKAYAGPIVVWRNPVVMPGDIEVWQAMPWPEDGRASACTMFFRKPVD